MIAIHIVVLCCIYVPAKATQETPYIHVDFKENILASEDNPFVRNNLTITNIYNRQLSMVVHITVPAGYTLVSQNDVLVELAVGENRVVPLTMSMSKTIKTDKKFAKIDVKLKNPPAELAFSFSVKCRELYELRATTVQREFQVSKDDRNILLSMKIKNTGNISNQFSVTFSNHFFQLNKRIKLELAPHKDTVINFPYSVPLIFIRDLTTEKILARIGNDTSYYTLIYSVSKMTHNKMQHGNAYATFPLTLETGLLTSGKDISYYFGVGAAIQINDYNFLSVNYRSKQFGLEGIQNDIFSVFYKHKKWDFSVGQLSDFRQFFTTGLGAQVTYHKNDIEGFTVTAISNLQSGTSLNKNQEIMGEARYKVGRIIVSSLLAVNQDPQHNLMSYVFNNKIDVLRQQNILVRLYAGAGVDYYSRPPEGDKKDFWGKSFGYDFMYYRRHWGVTSSMLINDNNFPGIYKGWRNQTHVLSYIINKNLSAAAYYNSNYTRQNFFIDSIYYDNSFLYNMTNYGVRGTLNYKWLTVSLGVGQAQNTGAVSSNLPTYRSINGDFVFRIKKVGTINFSSVVNYKNDFGVNHDEVCYYANRGSFNMRYGGVNLIYNRMPSLPNSVINLNEDSLFLLGYRNVTSVSPYLTKTFMRGRIQARVQYNYYKADETENNRINASQSLLGSISYLDATNGIELYMYGNYFLGGTSTSLINYGSVTLRKTFNVPVITHRKYYDLSMNLYEDKNGNGVRDDGDLAVTDVRIDINNMSLLSDEKGIIVYKNIEKGEYTLDFHNMKNAAGMIPSRGFKQTVCIDKNTKTDIPFNKGKMIRGNVYITFDSLSTNTFSKGRLRVTALDSAGEKFTTLTDEEGNFVLSVPENNYIVSLNPEAFDDNFRPVQMSFQTDMVHNNEVKLVFHIKQRARKVNKIKAEIK